MRYRISYSVNIIDASEQLARKNGAESSGIFEFPNPLSKGDVICIEYQTRADPTDISTWNGKIESIQNILSKQSKYTWLFVYDEAPNQNELEVKLTSARNAFTELEEEKRK
ncbi:hypothetical protein A3K73_07290 [Candidatus Pacearchaeota archaeon RBG_13_36_9]|nr:MAG: hypothetical protein A3K73_07290 [Candidatus Pacearchaeota archaeon RBG_13_36_9]HJX50880.1 hypothetical protein [Candidatus Nanoarchaeia archaeon]